MSFFNQPSDIAPVIQLYAHIAEKSANLFRMAQQERWDEFPQAESELNHLIVQLEKFDTPDQPNLQEADTLLQAVYIKQIMQDNERTAALVRERTSRLEDMLRSAARRQRLGEGYGDT